MIPKDLYGYQNLWQIIMVNVNPKIVKKSIKFLNQLIK